MPTLAAETISATAPDHALVVVGSDVRRQTPAVFLGHLGAAPLASPTFTGVPAAPTAAPGTDTTQIATTAFAADIAATLTAAIAAKQAALADGSSGDILAWDGAWVPVALSTLVDLGGLADDTLSNLSDLGAARTNLGLTAVAEADLASQALAEAGTDNATVMTPLRTAQAIAALAAGGADWGDIGGTLSAQTDLQAALDAKLALAGGTMTGALTIATGTLTDSAPGLNLTQTWNDAAEAFVAAEIDVTNTASIGPESGDSYLQRYKVNGSIVGGFVNFYNSLAARVREVQLERKSHGITAQNTISWNMLCAATYMASVRADEFRLAAAASLTWKGDSAPYSGDEDTRLSRVSSGVLKIVDGGDVLGGLQLGATSSALQVGTHAAIGAETVTGYVTLKDSGGTERKFAILS